MILNMLNGRLYTPVEVIIRVLFKGDTRTAKESIKKLMELKMLEYALNNRITITRIGKMNVRKQIALRTGIWMGS